MLVTAGEYPEYPTEGEVGRIVAAGKSVAASIVWNHDSGHNRNWADFRVAVENDGGWELRLYGNARVDEPKMSYSLSWHLGDEWHRIFALDVNGNHANHSINTEKWLRRTHKQVWRDAEPKFGYTPEEAIPEEPNAAFREFCRECNIVFSGELGVFPPT